MIASMPANFGKNTGLVNGHLTGCISPPVRSINRTMNLGEVLERIEGRLSALGMSADAASRAARKPDAIRNIRRAVRSGERQGVSTATLAALAPVLKTSAAWLVEGVGEEEPDLHEGSRKVPVVSWVSAGRLAAGGPVTDAEDVRMIADLPDGDWIALVVQGDSMDRVAPEGSVILVNRDDKALVHNRFYVFACGEDEATFKRYRANPPRMQPYSTNSDHETQPLQDGESHVIGRVMRVITDLW